MLRDLIRHSAEYCVMNAYEAKREAMKQMRNDLKQLSFMQTAEGTGDEKLEIKSKYSNTMIKVR